MRVATFNVRNGRAFDGWNSWPFRAQAAVRTIDALDADIVGLQEAYGFQQWWLQRRLRRFAAYGDGRNATRRGEHCCVLVESKSLRVVEDRTRWFGNTPHEPGSMLDGATFPRIATTVVAERAGERFAFTNTHLDQRSAHLRRASIDQLLSWLDLSEPNVIVGDFNATPDDPLFATLTAAGFRDALPADAGGTFHAFTGAHDGERIDYILVSEHFEVLDARIPFGPSGRRLASDHWPVIADISFTT